MDGRGKWVGRSYFGKVAPKSEFSLQILKSRSYIQKLAPKIENSLQPPCLPLSQIISNPSLPHNASLIE
ncbi:hypothetical protein N782_14135 [Pontibacillus yanchengensis Y32]|uniref:Uncharacterized protein n=1 Tax=Pontibacillus yanchengensis Y32 TaxID=1385514 RepID=A0A0A2TS59_9BACI|nr:hypothetical protein N782_14135 [Pontibacillus yanchengensis Y32]